MTRTLGLLAVGLYRMAGVFDRLAARVSCWRATRPLERYVDAVLPVAWVPFLGACLLALLAVSVTAEPGERWIAAPAGLSVLVAGYLMVQAWREAQR